MPSKKITTKRFNQLFNKWCLFEATATDGTNSAWRATLKLKNPELKNPEPKNLVLKNLEKVKEKATKKD